MSVPATPPVHLTDQPGFNLSCVMVSVNYDDFLAATLPHNKQMFDRVVVVTSPEDRRTRHLCEFHHVECIPTDVLETRWDRFCKGAGINVGLRALDLNKIAKVDGWVVHMDSDVWLPPQTRGILQGLELDKTGLYGIDRFIVRSAQEWKAFLGNPVLQHETLSWVHLTAFPLGVRVINKGGYIPIGFFQMWNPRGSNITEYPEGNTDAAHEDGLFARKWPRSKRHLLPEIAGYHLESEPAPMGVNWEGRKTKRFTV